jgi:uncharacterized membrane protein
MSQAAKERQVQHEMRMRLLDVEKQRYVDHKVVQKIQILHLFCPVYCLFIFIM